MARVLVTGATGFIGSHVTRALVAAGREVHALVRPQANLRRIEDVVPSLHLIRGDLLGPSLVTLPSSLDLCAHLAWYVEPGQYLESPQNNQWVEASLRLARAAKQAGCRRFVAAGTCFEYAPSDQPLSETSPTAPRTAYGWAKLELFDALQSLDMQVAWLRFFYQYGPFEDERRLVPTVVNGLLRGQRVPLTPGDQVRDYLHVEDVASAVVAVATSQLAGAVNIGSGRPVTVREIALRIGELIGRPDLLGFGLRQYGPSEPVHIVANNAKLRGTGWSPRLDLDSGLRQTIEWWRRHL